MTEVKSSNQMTDAELVAYLRANAWEYQIAGEPIIQAADRIEALTKRASVETTAEPARVLQWAVDSFGEIARNRDERAARLAEEAMEVAQAEGVPLETLKRIADRIYSRPLGELGQEVGGLGITLYALAANCGLDLFGEIEREWKRVLSKPRDWWQRKHAEKVAAGTADLTPITPEEPFGKQPGDDNALKQQMQQMKAGGED
jgi:NTP pyrophosphatase (non-canonical NTP hydrolase)